ncbi:unnamed protein product [Nezara viridula]|uniref:LRRCT domain-containing protein n=1 Tax=Nezara viridula TaxID=85310 RepID=A0A9P0E1T3_NEZVI|nr:unnamed protein product [Nezara viridula]
MAPAVFSQNTNLSAVKLTKNPWHCDCTLADFAEWLKDNKDKIWDMEPTCLGPGELGGRAIDEINREELCESTDDLPLAVLALYQRSMFFST